MTRSDLITQLTMLAGHAPHDASGMKNYSELRFTLGDWRLYINTTSHNLFPTARCSDQEQVTNMQDDEVIPTLIKKGIV